MIPLSIIIPSKNEEKNLGRCLKPLIDWADEILVVDSQSEDRTIEIAGNLGAKTIQFNYNGGWPKKRQWALENYKLRNEWVLLLDSDEILLPRIKLEIEEAIHANNLDGYWLKFQIYFLGKMLKFGDTELWKLSLFRLGSGNFEKRMNIHDKSMADIEIHEHVVVNGKVGRLKNPIKHENLNSLDRYIDKHNEYSNWEANLYIENLKGAIKPTLFGNQAQRRRWLKRLIIKLPFSYIIRFLYLYILKFGVFDGKQGFIHAGLKAVQYFHIKAKIFESLND